MREIETDYLVVGAGVSGMAFVDSLIAESDAEVVAMTARDDDLGYWLVASDGGVFSYGTAPFLGSMGGSHLNKPVVAAASFG